MPEGIILKQIAVLAILVITGVAGSRFGIISQSSRDFLARLIFNITLPSMLLTNFSRIDLTPRLLVNSLTVLLLSAFVILFMLMTGWLTSRIMKMKPGDAGIFRLHSMLGNIIYLGFPVISALFGEEGLLYASIFTLVSNFMMWTIGVMLITGNSNITSKDRVRHILNPNTIAIVAGFLIFISGLKLPAIILDSIGGLGGTNTYLSMIYIGSILFYASVRSMAGNRLIYILSFNRLLFVPLMLLGIFILLNSFLPGRIDTTLLSVLIMQSAMPCMVNVVIMVNILGGDDSLATANVFITTILSIFTLPLILLSLRLLG